MPRFKRKRASNNKSISASPSPKKEDDKIIEGVRGRGEPCTVVDKAADLLY